MTRPESEEARRRRTRYRLAFLVVSGFLVSVVVLVPFAVRSVIADLVDPQSHRVYDLTPEPMRPPARTHLNLDLVGVDEWSGTVSVRVTGQHICQPPCAWSATRVTIISIPQRYAQGQGLPPAVEVLFPSERAQPVNQTITLPVNGDPVLYPFDRYRFTLGFLAAYVPAEGTPPPPPGQSPVLFASVRSTAPRLILSPPMPVAARADDPSAPSLGYVLIADMTFSRPPYLKVLTVLLVMLVSAAAAYAVFLRPLDELVINSGALVLGVWGIRAILLGAAVPGITAVDLALSVVILFLLIALSARTALFLHARSGLPTPRRRRRARPSKQ